jgi:hypothetical protein
MTSEEQSVTGSDVSDVMSGTLGDAIEVWLTACAAKELEPRATCTTTSVTLKAGDRAWVLEATPESVKTAMLPFKSDARFTRAGVKRNGYTSCMYLLSHPKDVPYAANGHTHGTTQNASNTGTKVLGSVAKAQKMVDAASDKMDHAEVAFIKATKVWEDAKVALEDARKAEEVKKLEDAKKLEVSEAKKLEDATKNREALVARAAKLQKQLADMQALLDKTTAA